jgi:hypothetical protein
MDLLKKYGAFNIASFYLKLNNDDQQVIVINISFLGQ